jgi:hypothetical protein
MMTRKPLAKIAIATVAGSLALGGGVALAQLGPTDTAKVGSDVEHATNTDPGDGPGGTDATVTDDEAPDVTPPDGTKLDDGVGDDDGADDQAPDPEAAGHHGEHPDNHGKAVSTAAHDTPPGPGHGPAVSAVARGDHGHDATEGPEGGDHAEDPAHHGDDHGAHGGDHGDQGGHGGHGD